MCKLTAAWCKSAFGWAALLLWLGILFATLYPFQLHPHNDVEWVKGGLRFGRHGILMSDGPVAPDAGGDDPSGSIEIFLKPAALIGSDRFLVLSNADHSEQLRLTQYRDGLILWRQSGEGNNRSAAKRDVVGFFNSWELMLLTLTSGSRGTSVYANGRFLDRFPGFPLSRQALSGSLVFGTDTSHMDTWTGQLRGLALYNRELSPSEVAANYQNWILRPSSHCNSEQGAIALYTFQEGYGTLIHNLCPGGADLRIPASYVLPSKPFVAMPWREFAPTWDYLADVIRNILGFVPFGFAMCGYLWLSGRKKKVLVIVILLGAATSLGVEVLQGFLPQRDSGLTDVLTNTLGTALGAFLFTLKPGGLNGSTQH